MKINETMTEAQINKELSERIKQYRISSNMTQKMLSEKSQVSIKTISRFENGEDIGLIKLIKILKALELSNNLDFIVPDHTLRPFFYIDNRRYKKRVRISKKPKKKVKWKWGDEL